MSIFDFFGSPVAERKRIIRERQETVRNIMSRDNPDNTRIIGLEDFDTGNLNEDGTAETQRRLRFNVPGSTAQQRLDAQQMFARTGEIPQQMRTNEVMLDILQSGDEGDNFLDFSATGGQRIDVSNDDLLNDFLSLRGQDLLDVLGEGVLISNAVDGAGNQMEQQDDVSGAQRSAVGRGTTSNNVTGLGNDDGVVDQVLQPQAVLDRFVAGQPVLNDAQASQAFGLQPSATPQDDLESLLDEVEPVLQALLNGGR